MNVSPEGVHHIVPEALNVMVCYAGTDEPMLRIVILLACGRLSVSHDSMNIFSTSLKASFSFQSDTGYVIADEQRTTGCL